MVDNFSKSDNNYGLPEVDLVPIDRDQPGIAKPFVPPAAPPVTKTEKDNKWVPILLLIAIGLIVASAVFYFFFMDTRTSDTLADNTEINEPDRVTLEESEQLNSTTDNPDNSSTDAASSNPTTENQAVDPTINAQEPGTIRTISDRTGRYYIFLGSYKFKAYAQRHADKLASDGFAVKIITPDNWVGMRVAVGNYSSEAEAAADVSRIEAKYGNQVVVSKY